MDYTKTIEELRHELEAVKVAIATLEAVAHAGGANVPHIKGTRGRKSMGAEERLVVAARMRKYWASRRPSADPPTGADEG